MNEEVCEDDLRLLSVHWHLFDNPNTECYKVTPGSRGIYVTCTFPPTEITQRFLIKTFHVPCTKKFVTITRRISSVYNSRSVFLLWRLFLNQSQAGSCLSSNQIGPDFGFRDWTSVSLESLLTNSQNTIGIYPSSTHEKELTKREVRTLVGKNTVSHTSKIPSPLKETIHFPIGVSFIKNLSLENPVDLHKIIDLVSLYKW